jgi:hypothetical protein
MSQSRKSAESPRFRGTGLIIAVLVALFFYVAMGFGPFGADAYDTKGQPVQVQQFGSTAVGSADYRVGQL